MRHALARCDEESALAYLASSNPRNISLYERHGFEMPRRPRPSELVGSRREQSEVTP